MYDYTFTSQEELTEAEKNEIAKFEYKFVSKPEYEQNAAAESTDLLTSITPDIQTYEDNLLMSGTWTAVTVDGFGFNATNSNYIWQYNVDHPMSVRVKRRLTPVHHLFCWCALRQLTRLHIREFTFLNINFRTSLPNKQRALQIFFVATREYSTERLYAEV